MTRRRAAPGEAGPDAPSGRAGGGAEAPLEALDRIAEAVVVFDEARRVTYANAAATRLLGTGAGNPREPELPPALLRATRPGAPAEFEHRDEASGRWLGVRSRRLPSGGHEVVLEDLTERKRLERALHESEQRYRALLETTPDGVVVVGADGTLLERNASARALLGPAGRSLFDAIAPEFRDAFLDLHRRALAGERGFLEYEFLAPDGRRRMEAYTAPLHQPGGVAALAITRDITQRAAADRASALLRAIVDSSDDAIVSKDLRGIVTSWNRGAERIFGYTAAEVVGRSITLLIPPERLDEEADILARLQRGERIDHFETRRRRKDGVLIDVSLTVSPVKDASGRVVGASKIARDITDRKRAEAEIRTLNEQLASDLSAVTRVQQLSTRLVQADHFSELLSEFVEAGIEITGAEMGNIQLFREGVLVLAAHRGFEAPFLEFFQRVADPGSACSAALEGGLRVIVEDVEASPIFAGSRAIDVLREAGVRAVQSTPLFSRSGQLLGMFSTHSRTPRRPSERELRMLDVLARQASDLIERKRAELALAQSERRFRQLADSMPQMVWTARADGHVDYFNERWYEFTGLDRDSFGDESWMPVLHPDDRERCAEAWYEAVRTGRPYQVEHRFRDGRESRWRWFMSRALPARDDAGRITKWFGTSTDIDDQKRTEEELRRANEDLEQFAYSASHDLQEPLRGISIFSELLATRHRAKLDGQALEFLDHVREGASRMEFLVRDLLAYTRATRVEDAGGVTEADEALDATLANLASAIDGSGARIRRDPLPPVRVRGTHLELLFQNLIGNSIKYRAPDRAPEIHVGAEPQGPACTFFVRDNGIGIEPEYHEHVFGLFKRLHSGDSYTGTGIGLAICQRIVERYGGRIWVESEAGEGSTFRFSLPC